MGAVCISPCTDVGGVLYPPRTPSHPNLASPGHQQSPAQVPGLQGGGGGGWGHSKRGSLKGDGEGTPGHALQTRAGRPAQDGSRGTARALLRPTWQEESRCPGGRGRTAAATVAASSGQPSPQAARPGPAAAPRAARRAGPLNPGEARLSHQLYVCGVSWVHTYSPMTPAFQNLITLGCRHFRITSSKNLSFPEAQNPGILKGMTWHGWMWLGMVWHGIAGCSRTWCGGMVLGLVGCGGLDMLVPVLT